MEPESRFRRAARASRVTRFPREPSGLRDVVDELRGIRDALDGMASHAGDVAFYAEENYKRGQL